MGVFHLLFFLQPITACPRRQNLHPVSKKSNMASTCWLVSVRVTFGQHGGGCLSGVMRVCVLVQVELNGQINNPTAPEYVHYFFSALAFVSEHVRMNLSISCGRVRVGLNFLSFSVPGGPSLSCGSANDHRGAAADASVCPTAE